MPEEEPIVWGNVTAAIMSLLAMLVSLGVIDLLPEQMAAIEQAIAAGIVVLAPLLAALWARNHTTPLADPKIKVGDSYVELVRKDNHMPPPQAMGQ